MSLTRRGFLGRVAPASMAPLLPGGAWLSGCSGSRDATRLQGASTVQAAREPWPAPSEDSPFRHGVASGDPLADAVILWTRVTLPQAAAMAGTSEGEASIVVEWRLSLDPELAEPVAEGALSTDAAVNHTVHVDATGLASDTTYYFQFRALVPGAAGVPSAWRSSVRGRTKTLPVGAAARLRLGVVSCSNYSAGFFNVYALLAQADVDLVLHLGDYLYEYPERLFSSGGPSGRAPDPAHEILSLEDYRRRHAQYKTDADLQELHRQHVMVAVWDDHEIANNTFRSGAQNHQPGEGDFQARKQAALQAYREWMPLRPSSTPEILYRSFGCGDLLDLLMLDTRTIGRDAQVPRCDRAAIEDPSRQLLGTVQEAWLNEQLVASQARGTRWRLIGQQVIFAPRAREGCAWSSDSWDGYGASRARLFDLLEQGGIENVVVLTGDAHASWAIDVARDPFRPGAYDPETGRGSLLVELVAPAVSAPVGGASEETIRATHPHVKFVEQSHHGYLLLDVTPERALAEWYLVPTVQERSAAVEVAVVMQTLAGQPHLIPAPASLARSRLPAPAR